MNYFILTLSNIIKKIDHYLIKDHFKLVFNDNQFSTWINSNLFTIKTKISWERYLEKVSDAFENDGYKFNHLEELNILAISKEKDMSYDFFNKQNMHMIEWKMNAMINKKKNLIKKFNEIFRHPLERKFRNNLFYIYIND